VRVVPADDAEAALGEEVEYVLIEGNMQNKIERAELLALDLAAGAVAWKRDGKIHRVVGRSLEVVSVPSSIIKP